MTENKTLWFVPIRNEHRTTIQSAATETYKQALEEVLNKPKLADIIEYKNLDDNGYTEWIKINEQN